jgi:hypothetical protein
VLGKALAQFAVGTAARPNYFLLDIHISRHIAAHFVNL